MTVICVCVLAAHGSALADSDENAPDSLALSSEPTGDSDWGNLYLASVTGGLSVPGSDGFFYGQLIGMRGTLGSRGLGIEFALAGAVGPGGAGRGRYTVFPIYVHYYPLVRWHRTDSAPSYISSSPSFIIDLYLGGSAWAKGIGDPDGRSILLEDGYLQAGVQLILIRDQGGTSIGLDIGAVMARSVEDQDSGEVSGYAGLSTSLGFWY